MEVDKLGGEFNAFTSKEYTGYYIRCAGDHRDQALDVLVDMLRNSKFDAEEIEREKGVIVEEMNMYFDTPRDYIGGGVRGPPLRRRARSAGRRSARKRDDQGRDARDVPRATSTAGTSRRAWSSASPAWSDDDCCRSSMSACSATSGNGEDSRRSRGSCRTRTPSRSRAPPQGLGPGEHLPRCRVVPDRAPGPLRAADARRPCSAPACRRGSSSRCASAVAWRTTSTRTTRAYTDAGTLYSQAGVDLQAQRRGRARRSSREFRQIADEPVPAEELEKARALAKGRFVLRPRARTG